MHNSQFQERSVSNRTQRSLVLCGKILQSGTGERNIHPAGGTGSPQNLEMPLQRLNIAANDRPAEPARRSKLGIVRECLPQDRHHSAPRVFSSQSSKLRHFLRSRQQGRQQRRSECRPGVVCRLVLLANGIRISSEFFHNLPSDAHRRPISLDGERHSAQRRL